MKFKTALLVTLFTILTLGLCSAVAQGGPPPGPPDPAAMAQHQVQYFTALLTLTSAQQQQALTLFTNAASSESGLHEQDRAAHESLEAAVRNNDGCRDFTGGGNHRQPGGAAYRNPRQGRGSLLPDFDSSSAKQADAIEVARAGIWIWSAPRTAALARTQRHEAAGGQLRTLHDPSSTILGGCSGGSRRAETSAWLHSSHAWSRQRSHSLHPGGRRPGGTVSAVGGAAISLERRNQPGGQRAHASRVTALHDELPSGAQPRLQRNLPALAAEFGGCQ